MEQQVENSKFTSESALLEDADLRKKYGNRTLSLRFAPRSRTSIAFDTDRTLRIRVPRPRFSSTSSEESVLASLVTSNLDLSKSNPEISKIHAKVEFNNEEGQKEVKVFEANLETNIGEFTKKICRRFCLWEEWRYGLFFPARKTWLAPEKTVSDYDLRNMSHLQLRLRNADFFSSSGENIDMPSSRSLIMRSINVFTKNPFASKLRKGGIYLSMILFQSSGDILMTNNHLLPSILITKDEDVSIDWESENFLWIMKQWKDTETEDETSDSSSDDKASVDSDMSRESTKSSLEGFPKQFVDAANKCKKTLFLKSLGHIYEEPIYNSNTHVTFVVGIAYISSPDSYLSRLSSENLSLKWQSPFKLDTAHYNLEDNIWKNFMSIHEGRRNKIMDGLYVGILYTHITPKGAKVIVPVNFRQMCPVMKIRDSPWVTPKEWNFISEKLKNSTVTEQNIEELVDRHTQGEDLPPESLIFFKQFLSSIVRLKKLTGLEWEMSDLYNPSLIPIDDSGNLQMIAFVRSLGIESDTPTFNKKSFIIFPLSLFEIIHQDVYKSTTFKDFRRKSVKLEQSILQQETVMKRSPSYNFDDAKLKENILTLKKEKEKWRSSSWVFTLIEWHRQNVWKSMYNKINAQQ